MNPAVAIFVKTPGFSPIKTRMARRLGAVLAQSCYLASAACVAESARQSGLDAYWAVAEAEALSDPLWADLPRMGQPTGSLGRRMAVIHAKLVERHGSAILVGADLPQLRPPDLQQAAHWLGAECPRQVIGPANDGGFWLFGSNRSFEIERWESVVYSRPDTAQRFVGALADSGWKWLQALTDLDEVEDLPQVLSELQNIAEPTRSQHRIIEWLTEYLDQAA